MPGEQTRHAKLAVCSLLTDGEADSSDISAHVSKKGGEALFKKLPGLNDGPAARKHEYGVVLVTCQACVHKGSSAAGWSNNQGG